MQIPSIARLDSMGSVEALQALNAVGVFTLRDMAEFAPCRHAALLVEMAESGRVDESVVQQYVAGVTAADFLPGALPLLSIERLAALSADHAARLKAVFAIDTLKGLASFAPYHEAIELIEASLRGPFHEKPSAPPELIPKPIGSTHSQARFSNYVKEQEVSLPGYGLHFHRDPDEPAPGPLIIGAFTRGRARFHLGYLASIVQKWVKEGTHLGDIVHSLALAPGESRNVAVIEWYRRQQSRRGEDTSASETLSSEFTQTRALNEVVETTAKEHLSGSTESDASTRTTGAGLTVGQGSSAGGSAGATVPVPIPGFPLPILIGTEILGSASQSLGGSLVHSSGTVQGTLKSETSGERTVLGEVTQNITDATVQNASNVRALMSTVVVEDAQSGGQRTETRNVTNYNHSHALTVQYYEVLSAYRVVTGVEAARPVLYLPFAPIAFDIRVVQAYWHVFRDVLRATMPGKFAQIDVVVKDFDPANGAFEPSGELRLGRVTVMRARSYTKGPRVRFEPLGRDAETLTVSPFEIDGCMSFELSDPAVYVKYPPLAQVSFDQDSFDGQPSVLVRQGLQAVLRSTPELFRSGLANAVRTLDRWDLVEAATLGEFTLLNEGDGVTLELSVEYTLADAHGQEQAVTQRLERFYSFGQLAAQVDDVVTPDLAGYFRQALDRARDFNPLSIVAEIEDHFRFHQYAYTKYLLSTIEKEQIIDLVEHLAYRSGAESVPLASIVDPNPLGVTENLLIFKLKESSRRAAPDGARTFDVVVNAEGLFGAGAPSMAGPGRLEKAERDGQPMMRYACVLKPQAVRPGAPTAAAFDLRLAQAQEGGPSSFEGTVTLESGGGLSLEEHRLTGSVARGAGGDLSFTYRVPFQPTGSKTPSEGTMTWAVTFESSRGTVLDEVLDAFTAGLRRHEAEMRRRPKSATVFLPSSGVFAEAILGRSNASEYLDIRRFFNWQDSPIPHMAPALQAVNATQDFSKPPSSQLQPTVPVSVLNQISPMQPPATSLGSAFEVLRTPNLFPNMSGSGELVSILSGLTSLAQSSAQLAGTMASESAGNALQAAVQLGQQVAGLVGSAIQTRPPGSLTEVGTRIPPLEDIGKGIPPGSEPTPIDRAVAEVLGTPIRDNAKTGPSTGTGVDSGGPADDGTKSSALPARNTSDTLTGAFDVTVALPSPYEYAVFNLLGEAEQFVPDAIDRRALEIYRTFKQFIAPSAANDAVKAGQMVLILKQLKTVGYVATGPVGLFLAALDLLTNDKFIAIGEGLLALLYDLAYYYLFPYAHFSIPHAGGTWCACTVEYSKTKGSMARVEHQSTEPFNKVRYFMGGTPTPDPPAEAWAVQSLNGGALIWTEVPPVAGLTVSALDLSAAEGFVIRIGIEQELSATAPGLYDEARARLERELFSAVDVLKADSNSAIDSVVAAWVQTVNQDYLGAALDYAGVDVLTKSAILAAVAAGADVIATLVQYLNGGVVLLWKAFVVVIEALASPLMVLGKIPFRFELDLALEVRYQTGLLEGWTVIPRGKVSQFPELIVTHRGTGGTKPVLVPLPMNSHGLAGLLLPLQDIPSPTVAL